MPHSLYRATLCLHTPLGTPLAGDTLFGQLCWALREAQGEAELTHRLTGYTTGQPWLVVSDGFPAGFLPKPTLPQHFEPPQSDPKLRKAAKKNRWIPLGTSIGRSLDLLKKPLPELLTSAVNEAAAFGCAPQSAVQPHNTLNRLTGTTGEGEFAPYSMPQTFYAAEQKIDVYLVLDDARITPAEISGLLGSIGMTGFGRDASIGLGKFTLDSLTPIATPAHAQANAFWTLAPCAPQGQGFNGENSYWRVLTRFGRHGNLHALSGKPFKTPVLLASTGAIFRPATAFKAHPFIGQGLGRDGKLSKAEAATVHQGYAPVLPVFMGDGI
ncbi:MAG: hypothetical protein HY777_07070 [Betaproteobacteria bacterium]|nr:hypothetical protein [Betaproteobacteria bacterium]